MLVSKHTFTLSRKRRIKLAMAQGIPYRVAASRLEMEKLINHSCEETRAKVKRKVGMRHGA